MNTLKRFVLGFFSSLLLSASFAQAAVHFQSTGTTLHRYVGQPLGEDELPPPPPPPPDDPGEDGEGGENSGGN